MRATIHVLDISEPAVTEGVDLIANCGAVVRKATFAMRFECEPGDLRKSLRVCSGCVDRPVSHRYVYLLVSAEEMICGIT